MDEILNDVLDQDGALSDRDAWNMVSALGYRSALCAIYEGGVMRAWLYLLLIMCKILHEPRETKHWSEIASYSKLVLDRLGGCWEGDIT